MRLTKKEKETLYDLMDTMTDRCPFIDKFDNVKDREIFYGIFRKLRVELKGY